MWPFTAYSSIKLITGTLLATTYSQSISLKHLVFLTFYGNESQAKR